MRGVEQVMRSMAMNKARVSSSTTEPVWWCVMCLTIPLALCTTAMRAPCVNVTVRDLDRGAEPSKPALGPAWERIVRRGSTTGEPGASLGRGNSARELATHQDSNTGSRVLERSRSSGVGGNNGVGQRETRSQRGGSGCVSI